MILRNITYGIVKGYLRENNSSPLEYAGDHSAPDAESGSPMHDVTEMFPDMYTPNALKYYGRQGLDDASVIDQIQSLRGRPNRAVKIYRAVPNLNKDIEKKIKELDDILKYHFKYGFYPIGGDDNVDEIKREIRKEIKKGNRSYTYDEIEAQVEGKIRERIKSLMEQKNAPLKINNGDWVTTSRLYAKMHGRDNLKGNFKIATKTVKASQLYTEGNSIFEWGYFV